MNQLADKLPVAIVTGGARGIGLAVAARLGAAGQAVSLWDIDAQNLEQARTTLTEQGVRCEVFRVDVTDPLSVQAALAHTKDRLGTPSVLVNNAAIIGPRGPTQDIDIHEWQRVFSINVVGTLNCCQALVPCMLAQGYGRIVNMASVAGKEGNPYSAAYAASKAAVISLTKSLGKELAASGVLVNAVAPSAADTDIFGVTGEDARRQLRERVLERVPMQRFVRVEEVAELAAWLASEACSFSTASVFDISGGRSTY